MKRHASLLQRASGALLALAAASAGWLPVAYAHAEAEAADPPARVGRISALRGPVERSADAGAEWVAARINQPVTGGTSLWAPPGSQAEVRIGSGSVRLDSDTQAVFSQLDDHGIALDLRQGTVRARVRSLPSGDRFSLSADGVRAEAEGPGDYRVSYDPDRRIYTVGAVAGRLRIVSPSSSLLVEAGQEGTVERGGESLRLARLGSADARGEFDAWAEARDRDQDRLAAERYVSPETTGIEELDHHGRWDVARDYGAVWYPRSVPHGWAPYRYGHWDWVSPWGWTWIDDAPWGFAPFHYGRWALVGGAWGWVPGPIVSRPYYSPALVGYVGGRSGSVSLSIGLGIGAPIGWFPLAPNEYYHPPYRSSPRYANQVNIINVVNVHNHVHVPANDARASRLPVPGGIAYRYAQRPEALTVVSEDSFRNARSIGRDRVALDARQVAQLQPVAAALPGPRGDARASIEPVRRPLTAAAALPSALLPAPLERGAQRGDGALPRARGFEPELRGQRPANEGEVRARALPGSPRAHEARGADARLPPLPPVVNPPGGPRSFEPRLPSPAADAATQRMRPVEVERQPPVVPLERVRPPDAPRPAPNFVNRSSPEPALAAPRTERFGAPDRAPDRAADRASDRAPDRAAPGERTEPRRDPRAIERGHAPGAERSQRFVQPTMPLPQAAAPRAPMAAPPVPMAPPTPVAAPPARTMAAPPMVYRPPSVAPAPVLRAPTQAERDPAAAAAPRGESAGPGQAAGVGRMRIER